MKNNITSLKKPRKIYPDRLRAILLAGLLLTSPVAGLAANLSPANDLTKQCANALMGDIDASKIGNDPKTVAHLIHCALGSAIFEPTANVKAYTTKINRKKQILLNALFEKPWDKSSRSEAGQTVLMELVLSDLPLDWRLKKIEALIDGGINIGEKNDQGDTALSFAQYRGEAKVIAILARKQK